MRTFGAFCEQKSHQQVFTRLPTSTLGYGSSETSNTTQKPLFSLVACTCTCAYLRDMCIAHDLQAMRMRQRATRVSCILHLCACVVSHSACTNALHNRPQHLQLPHIHHLLRAQRLCTLVLSLLVVFVLHGSHSMLVMWNGTWNRIQNIFIKG